MAFSLLGRTVDGMLSLLSSQTFESRQDALAELGRITGDPAFTSWDDEVMLIDLDRGTPVLLVRPTAPAIAEEPETTAEVTAPEPAEFAAIADEEPAAETDTVEVPDAAADPEIELEEFEPGIAAEAPIAADAVDDDSEDESVRLDEVELNVTTGVEDEIAEFDEIVVPDVIPDAEPEPESANSEMDSLRAAIARTTQQMEASGVVAPDSIAGVAADAEVAPETAIPDEAPETIEPAGAPAAAELSSGPWPWSTKPRQEPDEVTSDDKIPEADVAFLLEGLEEPSVDDGGSLITSSIDAASLAASRPMILGAYGDSPAEPSADVEAPDADEPLAPVDSAEIVEPVAEPVAESDFILLESTPESAEISIPDAPPSPQDSSDAPVPTAQPAEDVLSLSEYACDDCVYVETCPNKDQRRPQDCGSFQWK